MNNICNDVYWDTKCDPATDFDPIKQAPATRVFTPRDSSYLNTKYIIKLFLWIFAKGKALIRVLNTRTDTKIGQNIETHSTCSRRPEASAVPQKPTFRFLSDVFLQPNYVTYRQPGTWSYQVPKFAMGIRLTQFAVFKHWRYVWLKLTGFIFGELEICT